MNEKTVIVEQEKPGEITQPVPSVRGKKQLMAALIMLLMGTILILIAVIGVLGSYLSEKKKSPRANEKAAKR